jgi:hypothetical protein
MFTEFNTLSDQSRIWIYQAAVPFTAQQLAVISAKCKAFINAWTRHGDDLKGSFTIKYNQFLILAVDESFNSVSGCSIDSSVHFIQGLETELELSLLDKMQVSFKDNASVNLVSLADFKNYAQAKKNYKRYGSIQ